MANLAFLAAVLVALSAVEGYSTLQLQCQHELQESSLDACRQVVNHQLAVQLPFFLPRSSQLRTGVQVQCCQQLQDISRECRAAAIRQIVRPYEHQALVPLRDDPYYPGEEEEQEGGSYYPGETYPQQEQGWEQQQGQGRQGSYQPSQAYRPQQHQQESYRPSQTSQEEQEQGWYHPSQTYQHKQQQGSYRPSQTYRPQQHQQGSYRPSQTFPQQQQQEEGFYGQSTAHQQQQQQQQQGRQEPYRLRITIYRPARQPSQHELAETMQQEGQGQYCGRQSQQTGFGGFSSPPRFGTEQQIARQRVVAKARQVAAQLPAMCRLQSSPFSSSEY
ncbi:unnamed protein product [Alopecurus aequalis]